MIRDIAAFTFLLIVGVRKFCPVRCDPCGCPSLESLSF